MPKQKWLPFEQEPLEALWHRFPAECRREVIVLYARLIGQAAQRPIEVIEGVRREVKDDAHQER